MMTVKIEVIALRTMNNITHFSVRSKNLGVDGDEKCRLFIFMSKHLLFRTAMRCHVHSNRGRNNVVVSC